MHHNVSGLQFLYAYQADSELWDQQLLGTSVLPLILEAMKAILKGDGIRACIDSRSNLSVLEREELTNTEEGIPRFWTFTPDHITREILGWYRLTGVPGERNSPYVGSPLLRKVLFANRVIHGGVSHIVMRDNGFEIPSAFFDFYELAPSEFDLFISSEELTLLLSKYCSSE